MTTTPPRAPAPTPARMQVVPMEEPDVSTADPSDEQRDDDEDDAYEQMHRDGRATGAALPGALSKLRDMSRSLESFRRAAVAEIDQHAACAKREAGAARAALAAARAGLRELHFEAGSGGGDEDDDEDAGEAAAAEPEGGAAAAAAMAELTAAVRRLEGRDDADEARAPQLLET